MFGKFSTFLTFLIKKCVKGCGDPDGGQTENKKGLSSPAKGLD